MVIRSPGQSYRLLILHPKDLTSILHFSQGITLPLLLL